MRAHRLVAARSLELVDVPRPSAPGPGQVVLRIEVGGVCGSDLPFFAGAGEGDRSPGRSVPGFPLHEVVGRVENSADPELAVGDRVVGWASGFDGLAECVVAASDGLAVIDEGCDPVAAIVAQPLACVLYAVDQMVDLTGRDAVVLGVGSIGALFSHVLAERGARVTGVDRVDRSGVADSIGLSRLVTADVVEWADSSEGESSADAVVEAIGHRDDVIRAAIRAARQFAQIYAFGIPDHDDYHFPMRSFLRKDLTLRSGVTHERRRMLTDAVTYLQQHPRLAKTIVTDVLPFDDAEDALRRASDPAPGRLKLVVDYSA